jgi:endonuclease/exonuclease/phosphatase (EEP) superfamily protein YafD
MSISIPQPPPFSLLILLEGISFLLLLLHGQGLLLVLPRHASTQAQRRQGLESLLTRLSAETQILAGDSNMIPPEFLPLLVRIGWHDAHAASRLPGGTWPAIYPFARIDVVPTKGNLTTTDYRVLPSIGSDHRPVMVRLRWKKL